VSIVTFRISAHIAVNFSTTIQLHFLSAASDAASTACLVFLGGFTVRFPCSVAKNTPEVFRARCTSGSVATLIAIPVIAPMPANWGATKETPPRTKGHVHDNRPTSGVDGCSQTYPLKRALQHDIALAVVSASGAVRDTTRDATSAPPAEIAPSLPTIQRYLHGLVVGTGAPACHKVVAATLSRVVGRV